MLSINICLFAGDEDTSHSDAIAAGDGSITAMAKARRPCVGLCYYEKLLRLEGKADTDKSPNDTALVSTRQSSTINGLGFPVDNYMVHTVWTT